MGAAAAPPTFGRIAEGVTVPLATGDGLSDNTKLVQFQIIF